MYVHVNKNLSLSERSYAAAFSCFFRRSRGSCNLGVVTNDDFTLTISFDNGEKRRYDVRTLLKDDTVFEPFKNTEAFRRVYVDENNAIAWDIDPTVDSRKIIR